MTELVLTVYYRNSTSCSINNLANAVCGRVTCKHTHRYTVNTECLKLNWWSLMTLGSVMRTGRVLPGSGLQTCCCVSWYNDSIDCTGCSCFVYILDFRLVRAVVVVFNTEAPFIMVDLSYQTSSLFTQSVEKALTSKDVWVPTLAASLSQIFTVIEQFDTDDSE